MKLYVQSLGCVKNRVDTEMLLGCLKPHAQLVETPAEAELIILNTCAFIEPARKEAIDTIFELVEAKDAETKLVVCGCLAQRYLNEVEKLIPEVDCFIPISKYDDFPKIIAKLLPQHYNFLEEFSPLNKTITTPNYMRYVKISEGCRNRCAFCAIPLIRGKLVSRKMESIVEEVTKAVGEGAYEINIVAQDTTAYGYDLYGHYALVELLEKLVKIAGDFKIRLLYLYPELVDEKLLNFIAENPKIMRYFDIPIQHCVDKILKAMKRRSNNAMLIELFRKIKLMFPTATLRTTLMVGFPYEEDTDVDCLIEFIKDVKFDNLGAFTFSLEENTYACNYPNTISEATKKQRYKRLMKVQEQIAYAKKQDKIGQIIEDVFIIDYDSENYMYVARSEAFAPDEIDGCIYVAAKEELQLGQRIKVKVLDASAYTLTAEQL